ncbi:unannotated protein [freshwater metagenome]|uniref:Unannotated protein n=1 Tax=freshwater metagenome TaxID=449393 RepID=A0A6J6ZBX0_9ZZZZ
MMHASGRSDSLASPTMCASRGCSGRANIRRPLSVMRPSVSTAPNRLRSSPACCRLRAGGGSAQRSSSTGVPQAANSKASPARSTWVISGSRCARRVPCSSLLQSRYAAPGSTRPARPARWSAEARLMATVVSLVIPVRWSTLGTLACPLSTTTRTPSTVSDDSAMSVASTTRRRPAGDGASARSCSAGESAPANGYTSTIGGTVPSSIPSTRRISGNPGRNTSRSPVCSRNARCTSAAVASATRSFLPIGA